MLKTTPARKAPQKGPAMNEIAYSYVHCEWLLSLSTLRVNSCQIIVAPAIAGFAIPPDISLKIYWTAIEAPAMASAP